MIYADTSALVKLVVPEAESAALRDWLKQAPRELASSDLARTELLRAVGRSEVDDEASLRAKDVLRRLTLVALTPELLTAAGTLRPTSVRSLDAIHLATALALGDDAEAILTYDDRLRSAARSLGLSTVAPQ